MKVSLFALLTATFIAPLAQAEIAEMKGRGAYEIHLFYVQRDKLHRATCKRDTEIYDHATCNLEMASFSASEAFAKIDDHYTRSIPAVVARQDQLNTKLARLEAQLEIYYRTSTPDVPVDALRAEIAVLDEDRGRLGVTITDLNDQIARVREELVRTPNPDLAAQLARMTADLAGLRERLGELDATLAGKRSDLAKAYAALGDVEDFRTVLAMRRETVEELEDTTRQINGRVMAHAASLRWTEHLLDPNFVWEEFEWSDGMSAGGASRAHFAAVLDWLYHTLPRL